MTRRPTPLILVAALLLVSTPTFAQHSSAPSSSSSSSSGGGHANSASSSASSAPSSSASHSGGASYSGGSSSSTSSHSSSGGANASSHSGGWNHSGATSGGNGNAHTNPTPGSSSPRGDHNSGGNHGASRSTQGDAHYDNQPHRPDRQPNTTHRSFEPAATAHDNGNRNDSGRNDRLRAPNMTSPQPAGHDRATRQPDVEHHSRMSRIFLFWKHPQKSPDASTFAKRENPEIKRPNPCKGTGCKPFCLPGQSLENGACAGQPIKPSQPPQEEVRCPDGKVPVNGVCPAYTTTYSRSSACDGLSLEIDSLERQLEQLYQARDRECARDSHGTPCYNLTNQIAALEQRLQQLRQQYAGCMSTHP